MSGEIDVVFFDFGGVFTGSPFDAVDALGVQMGAAPGQLRSIIFGPYHEDTDHPWHRLERGEIGIVDARHEIMEIGRAHEIEIDPFQALHGASPRNEARELFVACVRDLRARGYRTAMLTNNVREFGPAWRQMIPVDELFEEVIDSSEVGVRKPDLEIFRIALQRLGDVPPERSVFLDDFQSNIDAAERVGMNTVLVGSDTHEAIRDLERLLA